MQLYMSFTADTVYCTCQVKGIVLQANYKDTLNEKSSIF